MDNKPAIVQIMEHAQEKLRESGHIAPVALFELEDQGQCMLPLSFGSHDAFMSQCLMVGSLAKELSGVRVFLVDDTLMLTEKPEDGFDPKNIPLDDQRAAITIIEINTREPEKSKVLIQEYKTLGRKEPEFLPETLFADQTNEICRAVLFGFARDLPSGVNIKIVQEDELDDDAEVF